MSSHSTSRRMIRIGTRGSRLARWQADWVAERLRELESEAEIVIVEIKTQGDQDRSSPLAAIGGTGLFTKEIQRAVIREEVDLAVHSLKDLPTRTPEELVLAAIPEREDPGDALVAPKYKTLAGLPKGARVGTSAPRRRAQLGHLRPDLIVDSIRGNVETRLDHARAGRLDGVVLAFAGLKRLGLEGEVTELLRPPGFLPAVGQGALGIECRREDEPLQELLAKLENAQTRRAVIAERALLSALEGGCALPLAAWARDLDAPNSMRDAVAEDSRQLAIDAALFAQDGKIRIAASLSGPASDPENLGRNLAQLLLNQGATELLGSR